MKSKHDVIVEYSTYSRNILADLRSLSKLIRKYSATQRDYAALTLDKPLALTLQQIRNALLNPQNALKPSMAAFATLIKIEQDIIKTQERIQTQRETIRESIRSMREAHVMSKDNREKDKLSASSKSMEALLQRTGEIYQSLTRSQEDLQKYYQEIDQLALKHDEEWHEYRAFYLQQTLDELRSTDLELSEMEEKTLLEQDTWPQVLKDFETMQLAIPGDLNISSPNFETYFKLKAYLVVYSSLSRRMLPHNTQDVLKYVKKIL